MAIVLFIKKVCYARLPRFLKRIFNTVKASLMWEKALTWSTETYLSMAIGTLYAVKSLRETNFLVLKITVPLFMVYLAIWPLIIFFILHRNRLFLNRKTIQESIGSLYLQFDTNKQSCTHFTMFFLYRRLLFALIINFTDQYSVLQLASFCLTGLALFTYILYWQPMESKMYNGLAIFNECILFVLGFQIYLFTEYVAEPEQRYTLGKSMLWLVYFDIGVNLVALGVDIVLNAIHWTKRILILRKHKKAIESRNKIKG